MPYVASRDSQSEQRRLWTSTVIGHPVALIKRVNNQIARKLLETADLLDRRGGNSFRIRAYREAAQHLIHLSQPIQEIFRERDVAGIRDALQVGDRLGEVVRAAMVTGRMPLLDRLRAAAGPESVLQSVPGLGPVWADRIRHDLGIESLEELEVAAYDGRLEHVAGMGPKRLAGIRDSLASRLARTRPSAPAIDDAPSVAEILEVDREYGEATAAGRLPLIAPRRFNLPREAWLPVLHTRRGERQYTALYSNTARAHLLGRTHDWVVIYQEMRYGGGRTYTVITSQRGPLAGRRIVRGRELECAAYYQSPSSVTSPAAVGAFA